MSDRPIACIALKCAELTAHDIAWCETERHCGFAFQRRREQDRAEREEKDRRRQPSNPVAPEGEVPCRSESK